jgi:hypothetical protein
LHVDPIDHKTQFISKIYSVCKTKTDEYEKIYTINEINNLIYNKFKNIDLDLFENWIKTFNNPILDEFHSVKKEIQENNSIFQSNLNTPTTTQDILALIMIKLFNIGLDKFIENITVPHVDISQFIDSKIDHIFSGLEHIVTKKYLIKYHNNQLNN